MFIIQEATKSCSTYVLDVTLGGYGKVFMEEITLQGKVYIHPT